MEPQNSDSDDMDSILGGMLWLGYVLAAWTLPYAGTVFHFGWTCTFEYVLVRLGTLLLSVQSARKHDHQKTAPSDSPLNRQRVFQGSMTASIPGLFSRLLSAKGFFNGYFCGFWFSTLHEVAHSTVVSQFASQYASPKLAPFVNHELAILFATLSTCNLFSGWTHYCLSTKPRGSIQAWIPPFSHVFRVTWRAHLLSAGVAALSRELIIAFQRIYGIRLPQPGSWPLLELIREGCSPNEYWMQHLGKQCVTTAFCLIVTAIPRAMTDAILYRIHASMLPADENTMVPVDRAFGAHGARERGYLTLTEAWRSLGLKTWKKLFKFYAQVVMVYFVGLAMYIGLSPYVKYQVREWETTLATMIYE